ncbi:MAG: hypothetical protein M1829_000751 [Trizodia sp. TS-e1964]|nr:MAG: hypothetical protein M1829_000751 [Trizodia sp. TS-e1964]
MPGLTKPRVPFPRPSVLAALLLLLTHSSVTLCQNTTFTSLEDAFPQLAGLHAPRSDRSPASGGQNYTYCCLLAINDSLTVENGAIKDRTNTSLQITGNQLLNAKFPCGASYDGTRTGAPLVIVDWNWCVSNCNGWARSDNQNLNQWVQPLVGFILPAVVFCLTVPRRRKFHVPSRLFDANLASLPGILITIFPRAPTAALIAAFDTLFWIGVVISTAGPMILSGLYEAHLDRRLLSYVEKCIGLGKLSIQDRARILFVILVGNLDMSLDIPGAPDKNDIESVPLKSSTSHVEGSSGPPPAIPEPVTTWTHIEELTSKLHNLDIPLAQDLAVQNALPEPPEPPSVMSQILHQLTRGRYGQAYTDEPIYAPTPNPQEMAAPGYIAGLTPDQGDWIDSTKLRLRTMLACQFSFGTVIGAPVVFYTGSFIYTLVEVLNNLGDPDLSHSLSFGIWWMAVPHVAIISGCLLGGNNPNTLEGIIAHVRHRSRRARHTPRDKFFKFYGLVYESRYKPAVMWDRGRSKRDWVDLLYAGIRERTGKTDARRLREKISMRWEDWAQILTMTGMLIYVPFVLSFLISYHTPKEGVSCRSFTILIYALSQTWLIAVWIVDFHRPRFEAQNSFWSHMFSLRSMAIGLGLFAAVFSAVGGTLMQIIGVYRSCLCKLSVNEWISKVGDVRLETNSAESIQVASMFWLGFGVAAMSFLILATYAGWWYQRRLRFKFKHAVRNIDSTSCVVLPGLAEGTITSTLHAWSPSPRQGQFVLPRKDGEGEVGTSLDGRLNLFSERFDKAETSGEGSST